MKALNENGISLGFVTQPMQFLVEAVEHDQATGRGQLREDIEIGTFGPGSFFGEMSLLEDLPRVATVTTTEPSTVLVVHGRDFNRLVTDMPSVDRKMLIVLARRLRDLEDRYVPAADRVISGNIT